MPNRFFLKVDGIASECSEDDYKGYAECIGYDHSMEYNWTASSMAKGGATEIQAGAVKVIKSVGKDSPLLYQALHNREKIKSVEIVFERDNPDDGKREHYFTVKLTDCRISQANPNIDPFNDSGAQGGLYETIGFSYTQIAWTYEKGGIEGTFDFKKQRA